ncbi:hypothetical protein P3X46_027470 [Hevea brasiliensis]|uniref:Uncharacterized protein n=2 Tax=Hevea brasiliensis TaxID=3981 RepID=A0ABQ9L100_HEVBR|nr:hypothetical protein GH714_021774 [Hevea brasiliensis]KAJ9154096.1 hypothetical protein P3X46_027470 [Hevea brasiliensis]
MEEISETAKAYYANLSGKQKRLTTDTFQAIDANGDGKISFNEYAQYLKQKGFKILSSPDFFRKLDKDGNGALDFDEFITVHYICSSKRVYFCDECRVFLDGVYFTCVQCFNGPGNTYDLCCACYRDKDVNHHKDALFLDNYTLLQAKRQQNKDQDKNEGASEAFKLATAGIETTSNVVSLCSQM